MKFALVAVVGVVAFQTSAFAQEYTCSQDPECQQTKIEAMAMPQKSVDLKSLKADVQMMRALFMKGAMDASEGHEYGGFAKGVGAMDEYLARIDAIEKDPATLSSASAQDELAIIVRDMKNIREAYFATSN